MTTAENSRADALTEHQIAALWETITGARFQPGSKAEEFARAIEREVRAAPPASQSAAAPIDDNQIQVTHTIATEANAATILHGLLDSFVEVAGAFPSAVIDERLAGQVRIYLPAPLPADERAAFEAHLIDTYGVVQDDDPAIERVKRDWTAGWQAARATSANETGAEGETCRTCSGRGMIGGPSYYAPDEGGEPCPDCAAPQPAQADARVGLTADQREAILMAIGWHQYGSSVRDVKYAEALRALLDDDRA